MMIIANLIFVGLNYLHIT